MDTRISTLMVALGMVAANGAAGAQNLPKAEKSPPGFLRFTPGLGGNRGGDTVILRGEYVPATPELARKAAEIMALREIQRLGITIADIDRALPLLTSLREAENALQAAAQAALDEERRQLLALKPGDPLPEGSGRKLKAAAEVYQPVEKRAWERLNAELGAEKAAGLRSLTEAGRVDRLFLTAQANQGFGVQLGSGPVSGLSGLVQERPVRALSLSELIDLLKDKREAAPREKTMAPGAKEVLTEIKLRGNRNINAEAIRAVISSRVGEEVSPDRVERDRKAIESLGWFAVVSAAVTKTEDGNRLVFTMNEHPRISKLVIRGSSVFKEEQLLQNLKTRAGVIFNRTDWSADLKTLTGRYTEQGYQVMLEPRFAAPEFLESGILVLDLEELKVGKMLIRWPEQRAMDKNGKLVTPTRLAMLLSQKEPALYNVKRLQADYRVLAELGIFGTINPNVEVAQDHTVTITWELESKRAGNP